MATRMRGEHFVEPYSYVVFIDPKDGLVKARNGLTQAIDFREKDASTAINKAITALG